MQLLKLVAETLHAEPVSLRLRLSTLAAAFIPLQLQN